MSVLGLRSGGGAYVDCSSPECLELVAQQLIGKATDTDMPRRRVTATLPAAAVRELPGASVAATKTPRKRKPKVA